jgi:capsular polysaccharide biosynthesis protein
MSIVEIPHQQLGPERLAGRAEYRIGRSPRLTRVTDAIYIPGSGQPERAAGVFWPDGRAVEDAVLLRGEGERPGGSFGVISEPRPLTKSISGTHFYLGRFPGHYGHFLIELLGRMWPLPNLSTAIDKYVYHGPKAPEDILHLPYVRPFFKLLGLNSNNLMRVVAPTQFDELLVAESSFQIRHHVYPDFFKLYDYIFEHVRSDFPPSPTDQPLYLSKTKLRRGVSKILNEIEIESYLRAKGARIIYPETMDILDQLAAVASHQMVVGVEGSALHTVVIDPRPKQILCISHSDRINSNYVLIDKGRRNDSVYFFPTLSEARDQNFEYAAVIKDTNALNAALCRHLTP